MKSDTLVEDIESIKTVLAALGQGNGDEIYVDIQVYNGGWSVNIRRKPTEKK
jgi:hypothetical protein